MFCRKNHSCRNTFLQTVSRGNFESSTCFRFFMLLFLTALLSFTQPTPTSLPDSSVIIRQVVLKGNYRTRDRIVLREMALHPGDTVRMADLSGKLDWDKNKISNTNLFITVAVRAANTTTPRSVSSQTKGLPDSLSRSVKTQAEATNIAFIDVEVLMKERWYVIVYPVFEFADRNFNEWWYQRGRDLRRTVYGARLSYKNVTGNNDKLGLIAEFGFLRRFAINYQIPYLDRAQRLGLKVETSYQTNNEIAYRSQFDKLQYVRNNDQQLREQFIGGFTFTRRNGFYRFHDFTARYISTNVADTVARLNPDYFLNGQKRQQYAQLAYGFRYDRRDNVAYPLRGTLGGLEINWLGVLPGDNVHQLETVGSYARFWPLGGRWFASSGVRGQVIFPEKQPYNLLRGLGYRQEVVRGYELYSVEGQHFALWKSTVRFQLFNTVKQLRWLPIRQFNTVPIAAYFTAFADAGYVWNSYKLTYESQLANQLMVGSGMSLDVVTYYNLVARFSLTVNAKGESGFFFNLAQEL
jgi:outer membrane protein assembly factor BamA